MFKSWYPPNMGCLRGLVSKRDRSKKAMWMGSVQESHVNGIGPREPCEWDWSKRAMWMGSVQESNVNGIGPREQCEWDGCKRAMWMGWVQESHMNGIGPREQCEWDQSTRAMWMGSVHESNVKGNRCMRAIWMGLVQESDVNGIGPREQCEWDWSKRAVWMGFGTQSKRVQTTHDYPWPDTAGLRCAREFRACGAASRAFGASRRSTACLPACHYCTHSCLVPACLPATAPLLWPPARLSPLTLSSRARMHLRALSLRSLSHSFVFFSSSLSHEELLLLLHPIPISCCCSPLHVCFFFLAFQLSFWHDFFFFSFRRRRSLC